MDRKDQKGFFMPSSQEKIIAYHISRLRDKRPEVLMEAIRGLEPMGAAAVEAVEPLRNVFETADDIEVKNAARIAAYNIFMAAKAVEETDGN
jgi:hypothetical protein